MSTHVTRGRTKDTCKKVSPACESETCGKTARRLGRCVEAHATKASNHKCTNPPIWGRKSNFGGSFAEKRFGGGSCRTGSNVRWRMTHCSGADGVGSSTN